MAQKARQGGEMTDIIKLAREAGFHVGDQFSPAGNQEALERFAELVAAHLKADAERYRWLRNTSQISASSTGKGIAFPHYVTSEMQRCELDAAIDAARAKEQT
jgi:hypothetical protein